MGCTIPLRLRAVIISAVTAATLSTATLADPTSAPVDTAVGVFGEGKGNHGEPDKSGAMTYTYPFQLASARGGPQPKLALSYVSTSRDREAGYGWGLNLPVIERRPLSGFPRFLADGTPFGDERYTFNGQPLVLICKVPRDRSARPGEDCGSEAQPRWATEGGWRYYRLQIEGAFSRFYLSPDRRYWFVQLKGGERLEFGEPPDGRGPGVEHARSNENAIIRWRLVKHSDAVHTVSGKPTNYVSYRWERLGTRGLLYLTDIYDTPPADNPSDVEGSAHHVQLTWEVPDFPQTAYAEVDRATPDWRLVRVGVSSLPWSGDKPREVIRLYKLRYAPARTVETLDLPGVAPLWHHSFLREIQMEGRCGRFEEDGKIPESVQCPALPATTFEYEPSLFGFLAGLSKVHDAPPNADVDRRVIPSVPSTGIIDFNRDGLPDIVQSWEADSACISKVGDRPYNTDGDPVDGLIPAKGTGIQESGPNLVCIIDPAKITDLNQESFVIQNARPIVGYLNGGSEAFKLQLYRQCMDAGTAFDASGLVFHNRERPAGFFTGQAAATVVGSWGHGILAWSRAQFAPYLARPVLSDYGGGSGCDLFDFHIDSFMPGWKWEQTRASNDWARRNPNLGTENRDAYWYVDVDGDGLTDRLGATSSRWVGDFAPSSIAYTRQYRFGEALPGGAIPGDSILHGPVLLPFFADPSTITDPNAVSPSPSARKETKFFYVDINGDGLVDLVSANKDDDGGVARVRPGNGRGEFACHNEKQPLWTWPCLIGRDEPTASYSVVFTGSRSPWPLSDDMYHPLSDDSMFHDVNGDGLADFVQYDMWNGEVYVWFNQDGRNFACITPTCSVGVIIDDLHATINIGRHRIAFADMDGNGTDDLVVLAGAGVFVGHITHTHDFPVARSAWAPRPGLLTKIHNGYGATTHIKYESIQQLDLSAKKAGKPWSFHSPTVGSVVTRILTQNDDRAGGTPLPEPYRFERSVEYQYRDPAYDAWTRTFAGFRKIRTRTGDEAAVTETTYWFGPCQNNALVARIGDSPVIEPCRNGSDHDQYQAATGRVARIDRFVPEVPPEEDPHHGPGVAKYLWTKKFGYRSPRTSIVRPLFERQDQWVLFDYPETIDTYIYDDSKPTFPDGADNPVSGGDPLERARRQDSRKYISRGVHYDDLGNLRWIYEGGAEPSETADTRAVTLLSMNELTGPIDDVSVPLACTADWVCLPNHMSIWNPDAATDTPLRKLKYTYSRAGDVSKIEGWLEEAERLQRHHASGSATAPPPAAQSVARGWHTLATYAYDVWGNLERRTGGGSPSAPTTECTQTAYEVPFRHLPMATRSFKSGCGSDALETRTVYDRGFEVVVDTVAPNGSRSQVKYDAFGRPERLLAPAPDSDPSAQLTVDAATISYGDGAPLSYVDTSRVLATGVTVRSIRVLNGLSEAVMSFDQGDTPDEWFLSGWTERNRSGLIKDVRHPWQFTGDPLYVVRTAWPLTPSSDAPEIIRQYDAFGRVAGTGEAGAGWFLQTSRTTYSPLAVTIRDAEQVKPGGERAGAFTRIEYDGHGRTKRAVVHSESPVRDDITTTVTYLPTDEPIVIERSTGSGGIYRRMMKYDSLGRLGLNAEPNTGNNLRYVWDDAGQLAGTSDARGCGANYYYDGLGRTIAEEYSPCTEEQPGHSPPDLATASGLAVLYRYDSYEPGQIRAEPGFLDDARFAVGKLTSVRDRGSHTRFNYDARGRMRRESRQLAAPSPSGTISYAPHWFETRYDYDLGNRLIDPAWVQLKHRRS
jgi:YD repeat-containing protein